MLFLLLLLLPTSSYLIIIIILLLSFLDFESKMVRPHPHPQANPSLLRLFSWLRSALHVLPPSRFPMVPRHTFISSPFLTLFFACLFYYYCISMLSLKLHTHTHIYKYCYCTIPFSPFPFTGIIHSVSQSVSQSINQTSSVLSWPDDHFSLAFSSKKNIIIKKSWGKTQTSSIVSPI